jgi:uncharacterized membrane protein YphA (DoxX/SURF4 family)
MYMLNPFPDLLTYGFFAPTLLRVAVALVFFLIGWRLFKTRDAVARVQLPFVGEPGIWLIYIAALIDIAVGVALLIGYGTQIAALLGAVIGLKHAWYAGRYPLISPRSRSVYILVAVICLSLMASGAGAFAMDLRL